MAAGRRCLALVWQMASPRPLIKASDGFLSQLDKQGDAAVKAMLARYEPVQRSLQDALDRLEKQISELESPTNAQLYKLDRYQSMLQQVNSEMSRMGQGMASRMPDIASQASEVALEAAKELVLLQSNAPAIVGAFNRMSLAGVQTAASYVAPGSPLMDMLNSQYGEGWSAVISSQFVTGVALGQSPRAIVAGLRNTVDIAMPADLNRIIRTAQLYSYRQTNHQAWKESGVVSGWVWVSALIPGRTCGSCWAMHGTKHDNSEILDDHHLGLCAPAPIVSSDADYQADPLNVPTGESIFRNYPDAKQVEVANAGGWGAQYRAYKDGAISFGDMTRNQTDSIYGNMRSVAPLKALLGADASKYYS